MPRYRIYRIKESPRENFRWAPHTGGLAIVRLKDYDSDGEVEALTPYAVWKALFSEGRPLRPGDLLERSHVDSAPGQLHVTKYIGFEPASWYVTESPPGHTAASAEIPGVITIPLPSDPV
jgi:hypothetical protein